MKSALRSLKQNTGDISEMQYVSDAIRDKITRRSRNVTSCADDDVETSLRRNFWKTCKKIFNAVGSPLPSFNLSTGAAYFKNILRQTGGDRRFTLPSWLPPITKCMKPFNTTPSYQTVTRAVKQLRSSSSPCPLDQIPALVLKKCPIICTALQRLIEQCWLQSDVPKCWKRAMTILIFKKGDTSDPVNFRPITLQPIMYKILSAIYRDRLYINI